MQHYGALDRTEREARYHRPVRQGGGKEPQIAHKERAAGYFGEVPPGLQGTIGGCDIVQIYGKGADSRGQRLAGNGRQPEEG